jgi:hypothetical protein
MTVIDDRVPGQAARLDGWQADAFSCDRGRTPDAILSQPGLERVPPDALVSFLDWCAGVGFALRRGERYLTLALTMHPRAWHERVA